VHKQKLERDYNTINNAYNEQKDYLENLKEHLDDLKKKTKKKR
jgi:hypothetical protein